MPPGPSPAKAACIRRWVRLACATAILLLPIGLSNAQTGSSLSVNEHYVTSVRARQGLDLGDVKKVFAFVFKSLGSRVRILPTENYFYFSFFENGVEYGGNIRLDALDRDRGALHFAFFLKPTLWAESTTSKYRRMTAGDGVEVTRKDDFNYRVTFAGKVVQFALNDLRDVKPDPKILRPGESYLGPVFDESGIEFFLIYNDALKQFFYVLNEQKPVPDNIEPSGTSKSLVIGRRTGFVFYSDRFAKRQILVGVHQNNVQLNNFFDGPFDQLPDNFIKGDALKNAMIGAYPDIKDAIDRFGNFSGGEGRVLINPYLSYLTLDDFSRFLSCVAKDRHEVAYYTCFNLGEN